MKKILICLLCVLPYNSVLATPVSIGMNLYEMIDTYEHFRQGTDKASSIKSAQDLSVFYNGYKDFTEIYDAHHKKDPSDKLFYQSYKGLPDNFFISTYDTKYHLIIIKDLNVEQCKLLKGSISGKLYGPIVNPAKKMQNICQGEDNVLTFVDY